MLLVGCRNPCFIGVHLHLSVSAFRLGQLTARVQCRTRVRRRVSIDAPRTLLHVASSMLVRRYYLLPEPRACRWTRLQCQKERPPMHTPQYRHTPACVHACVRACMRDGDSDCTHSATDTWQSVGAPVALKASGSRDPSMRDDPHTATLAGAICMPPLWMQGDAAAPGCLSVEAESGRTVPSGGRRVDVPVLRGAVTPSRHMAFRSAMRAPRMMSGPRQSVKRKHSHEHKVNKHTHSQTPPSLFMTDRLQSVSVSPHTLRA